MQLLISNKEDYSVPRRKLSKKVFVPLHRCLIMKSWQWTRSTVFFHMCPNNLLQYFYIKKLHMIEKIHNIKTSLEKGNGENRTLEK